MTTAPVDAAPLVEIGGAPRARGRQYGRLASERIRRSIAIYNTAFELIGLGSEEAVKLARAFMPDIEAYDANSFEEMIGISEGAGCAVEHIVALNARTEMLYWRQNKSTDLVETEPNDGCTGAVVLPESAKAGHLLHGQNWDWRMECAESVVVLRVFPDESPGFLTFVEAGILARAGMNESGIALTGNFLRSDRDHMRKGVPIPLVRRRILQSQMFSQAIGAVYEAPRSFSCNLMISQAAGEAISLEASPEEVFWIEPEGGLLVHANHFKSPGALAKIRDLGPLTTPDSLYRDGRMRRLLKKKDGELTLDDLGKAFQDRFGSPRAICRSPTLGPGGSTSATVATILMDPQEGSMRVVLTPHQSSSVMEYRLKGGSPNIETK